MVKANRKQIYSIIILLILIIIFIVLMILIVKPGKKTVYFPTETIAPPEINFAVLQNPILLRLGPYPITPEITDSFGRADPFANFATTTATSTKK